MTSITTSKIERIKELVSGAVSSILEAGNVLCELVDEDPSAIDALVDSGTFTRSFLRALEAVGRKQLHPELFFASTPGHRKLRALPYSEQSRFLTEPVKLLVLTEAGGASELCVKVENLTTDQAAQAFGGDGVRSPAAQRAFIEAMRLSKHAPHVTVSPYRVKGKTVAITQPCSLGMDDLLNILKEMSK